MNHSIQKGDRLQVGLAVLSNALPPVGFYLSYKYKGEFPKKARTALINALLGIPIGWIGALVLQYVVFK